MMQAIPGIRESHTTMEILCGYDDFFSMLQYRCHAQPNQKGLPTTNRSTLLSRCAERRNQLDV